MPRHVLRFSILKDDNLRLLVGAILILGCALFMSSCSLFNTSISKYDPITHKYLYDLKGEIQFLYEEFSDSLDIREIKRVKFRLNLATQYEKEKGEQNDLTLQQLNLVLEEFEDNIRNRIAQGPWNQTQIRNSVMNISRLIDQAIKSEISKNLVDH